MYEYRTPGIMPNPTTGVDTVDPNPPIPEPKTYDLTKPILTLPNGITLRAHSHADAEPMSRYANNKKILRTMTNRWPVPYTVDKMHDWISTCRDETRWVAIGPTDPKSKNTAGLGQKLPTAWVICLNGEPIGGCGGRSAADVHSRTLTFGYWLAEPFWRRGIMSTVLGAYVDWVFENYPWIVKLEAGVYGWNQASAKLLEKCGFELEGRQRCSIEKFGRIGDLVLYGRVREGIESSNEPPSDEKNLV